MIDKRPPTMARIYNMYDKKIFPKIEFIRGTYRLNVLFRKIATKNIVKNNCLQIVNQKPFFSKDNDVKYVFMETKVLEKFLDSTENTEVFCDVGGYHGFYSLVSNSEKSIVFEPDPENTAHLRNNIDLNPNRSIELIEKAVWSSNKTLNFEAEGSGTSHVAESGIERQAITLDSFFEDREAPDVIKIDVEGAGYKVLKGATKLLENSKPDIFIELHDDERIESFGGSREKIEDLLKNHSYEQTFEKDRGGETHQIWKNSLCTKNL